MKSLANCAAAVLVALVAQPTHAAETSEEKTTMNTPQVHVTASGEVRQRPDMAEVNLGVVSEAETAESALKENNQAMQNLLAVLKENDIPDKHVQTSRLNISPRYQHDRSQGEGRKIVGYQVTNQVHVRVDALKKLGVILDKAISSGANQIHGIQFSVSNPEDALNQARRKAVQKARQQAELLASEAGVNLGRVLEIQAHQTSQPRPMAARRSALAESAKSVPIAAGEQTLSATVRVTYELVSDRSP